MVKHVNEEEESFVCEPTKHLSKQQLAELFIHNSIIKTFDENDPDTDRSTKIDRETQNLLGCHEEHFRDRKNASCPFSVDHFIKTDLNQEDTLPYPLE